MYSDTGTASKINATNVFVILFWMSEKHFVVDVQNYSIWTGHLRFVQMQK
jgi:hypothetical protein